MLFLRDLDLSHEQHLALGRVFGPLEGHPVIAHIPGYREILDIRGSEARVADTDGDRQFRVLDKWHSDVTFRARPSFGAVLRARELPALGGDTLWCDAAAAYAGLSNEVKAQIDGRTAIHDLLFDFGERITAERRATMAEEFPPQHHPIVRTHPETGAPVLFVNASFTSRIDDIEEAEGARLLQHLLDQFKVPEYQVRFRWTPNAVAIWDNLKYTALSGCTLLARATVHGAGNYRRRPAALITKPMPHAPCHDQRQIIASDRGITRPLVQVFSAQAS